MSIEVIDFSTEDGYKLHGLAYKNEKIKNKTLAIYIHGAGNSNVLNYGSLLSVIYKKLKKNNIDLMAFNNRGSGYISKINKYDSDGKLIAKKLAGMAYEKIEECVKDIDAAINWGLTQGYKNFTLIGHSTGANKIVFYLSKKTKNSSFIAKVFLLAGGDDIYLQTSRLNNLEQYRKKIKSNIKLGHENDLVPADQFPGDHPISYASLYELISENSDYDIFPFKRFDVDNKEDFYLFKKINIPVIAIYGSEDFGTIIPVRNAVRILKQINRLVKTVIIENADHNFTNKYDELAAVISEYISQ